MNGSALVREAERLGFEYPPGLRQPGRRAFDIAALDASDGVALAGEAKKARGELDSVLSVMQRCGQSGPSWVNQSRWLRPRSIQALARSSMCSSN